MTTTHRQTAEVPIFSSRCSRTRVSIGSSDFPARRTSTSSNPSGRSSIQLVITRHDRWRPSWRRRTGGSPASQGFVSRCFKPGAARRRVEARCRTVTYCCARSERRDTNPWLAGEPPLCRRHEGRGLLMAGDNKLDRRSADDDLTTSRFSSPGIPKDLDRHPRSRAPRREDRNLCPSADGLWSFEILPRLWRITSSRQPPWLC